MIIDIIQVDYQICFKNCVFFVQRFKILSYSNVPVCLESVGVCDIFLLGSRDCHFTTTTKTSISSTNTITTRTCASTSTSSTSSSIATCIDIRNSTQPVVIAFSSFSGWKACFAIDREHVIVSMVVVFN
jgi:hypothetical protein